MNILFLSLSKYRTITARGIYSDLLRCFVKKNDKVHIISPADSRKYKKSEIVEEKNSKILTVYTGKIQKTNIIEKGINTLLLESRFISAIKKNFKDINLT